MTDDLPQSANTFLRIGERADEPSVVQVYVSDTPWLPSEPFAISPELITGEELNDDAHGETVVNASALEALGYSRAEFSDLIGQEIALVLKAPRGDVQDFTFRLIGIINAYDDFERQDSRVYLSATGMLPLKAWWYNDPDILEREGYDALTIKAASLNDAVQIVEQLEARNFDVESLKTILDTVNKTMVVLQTMLSSIGGLALLVASIGIANTMIMSSNSNYEVESLVYVKSSVIIDQKHQASVLFSIRYVGQAVVNLFRNQQ